MAAGNHSLGTIRGTIEIDYDGSGIVKASKDAEKAKGSLSGLDGASSKVLGSFGKFAGGAAKVAGAIGLANNAVGLLAGTLAVVGPLAAAGFAAAPGLILAYQGAMVIAKIATEGVGKALGAAGEDAAKFDKAIKELSPEAQKFAKAFRSAYPQVEKLKDSIQDAFFKGTAGQVAGVVQRIASLRGVAVGVSSAMSKVAQDVIRTGTNSTNIERLRTVLGGVQVFLTKIRTALGTVLNGFINLGSQAAQFAGVFGGSVNEALQRFGTFLNQVDLNAVFADALPILKSLGEFFGDVFTIVKQLFSVFQVDGANAAGILSELASKLADFLSSAQGQAALTALGEALQAISGAAGQIFLALLQALAPTIVALAPGVALLATQIASVLVPGIQLLNPLLSALAGFLSENMSWIGPLAGAVGALAVAYKVYAAGVAAVNAVQALLNSTMLLSVAGWVRNTAVIIANRVALVAGAVAMGVVRAATVAWTAVQWLLNAALTANPIGIVIVLIAALVAGIIYAWKNSETFRNVVISVWNAIKTAIGAVVSWITGTVWPSLQRAWQQIQSGATALWNWLKSVWNGIKTAISVSLNAIQATVRAVWNGITSAIRTSINLVRSVITAGFNAARANVTTVLNGIRNVARTVWAGIVAVIRSQVNAVKNVINGIRTVIAVVRNAFNQARSVISSALSSAVSVVRGFPGRVAGALGNLGGLLYSKGKALIQGFINGIKAMAGKVAGAVKSVVGNVTKFLPGSPAKEGPLSGRGYVYLRAQRFMTDFAKGIQSGRQKPVNALYGTTAGLARATLDRLGPRSSGGGMSTQPVAPWTGGTTSGGGISTGGGGGSLGDDVIYRVQVGDKPFFDLVTDALSRRPVTVKNLVQEATRRAAWAGSGR